MKVYILVITIFFSLIFLNHTFATIKVVTTLPDLADFTKAIGNDRVEVDFIVKGTQNPHYIEVKPSYMMKLRNADIFLQIGMELELWAQQIIDGSRNNRLIVVDCSNNIEKLEIPSDVDASQGDIHRYGNPHYWLDPMNVKIIMQNILNALIKVSPEEETYFKSNMDNYLSELNINITNWLKELEPFKNSNVITFHKSWTYFAKRFGLNVIDYIEPRPGITPTPSHTLKLLKLIKENNIKVIIVEPFYDDSVPKHIAAAANAKVIRLATSVGGVPRTDTYISLIDYNVKMLKENLK
ncbi:MAG: metal ABC transporter substrate-binding protein [Bacteroidota bacterium]|nr:metal ABC transporter substrate-binding protein [Bacteroidota bacterium]